MWEASAVLGMVLTVSVHAAVPAWERAALVDLFHTTGGHNWRQPRNWLQGDPCENSWFGIFCDPANVSVLEVFPNPRLSGNPLVGSLPDSLYNLSNLEHLYVSNDRPPLWSNLHGPLSPKIGRLTKLKCLYLAHAGPMSGPLPAELGTLTNLQGIYTRWTNFSGPLPDLSRLRNLSKLIIDGAPVHACPHECAGQLSGTIDGLTALNLAKMIHLDVAGNQFIGAFPHALCAIKKCTAWGNKFAAPQRPQGCCDGVDEVDTGAPLERSLATNDNECHPHSFPGGYRVWQ